MSYTLQPKKIDDMSSIWIMNKKHNRNWSPNEISEEICLSVDGIANYSGNGNEHEIISHIQIP